MANYFLVHIWSRGSSWICDCGQIILFLGDEILYVSSKIFAIWTFGTKSNYVVWAKYNWCVCIFTSSSIFTISLFVVWTLLHLNSILMKVFAIFILTISRLIVFADGHSWLIILMKKLTILSLFAKILEPVCANYCSSLTFINDARHL